MPGIGIPVFYRCAGASTDRCERRAAADRDARHAERSAHRARHRRTDGRSGLVSIPGRQHCRNPGKGAARRDGPCCLSAAITGGADLAEDLTIQSAQAADQILQLAILQACRLLSGRPRDTAGRPTERGTPEAFPSHTKRDQAGLKIATALKHHLDELRVGQFFDEVSIQPGDDLSSTLKDEIQHAALVAIRTDQYVTSPWCRMELDLAKRARRPMVVVDALATREQRSSPLLVNLPSVRLTDGETGSAERLAWVTTSIALEVLRFLYSEQQLDLLNRAAALDAILLTRPPEMRDLLAVRDAGGANLPWCFIPIRFLPGRKRATSRELRRLPHADQPVGPVSCRKAYRSVDR